MTLILFSVTPDMTSLLYVNSEKPDESLHNQFLSDTELNLVNIINFNSCLYIYSITIIQFVAILDSFNKASLGMKQQFRPNI